MSVLVGDQGDPPRWWWHCRTCHTRNDNYLNRAWAEHDAHAHTRIHHTDDDDDHGEAA